MEKNKKKESKRHAEAFRYYADLRAKEDPNSMQKTADKFGIKLGTLYNWSYEFNWKEKYEEEERKAREKVYKAYQRKIEKAHMDNVDKTIDLFYNISSNIGPAPNSPSYSVKDFETMSKLLILLTGGATERVENNNTEKMSEEDRKAIERFSESLGSIVDANADKLLEKIKK